jgi:uncharacterized protein YbjT (DUF2867 family)
MVTGGVGFLGSAVVRRLREAGATEIFVPKVEAILSKTRAWSRARVISRFRGGQYLAFIPPVMGLYLRFEDSMIRERHRNLAPHYLLISSR